MFSRLRSDIQCILERDPAARSAWEVLTCYPGLHAVLLHRPAHWCWVHGFKWLGRFVSHNARFLTGIEIHPGAKIGERVFFDHAMGVVIGETAEVGDGCTIYQGVTLGGTSLQRTKRHPTLGKNVTVGSGAAILGAIFIGDGAKIGANSVVVKDVPANATVVGIPGRVVLLDGKPVALPADRGPRVEMPDPYAPVLTQLAQRVAELEARLAELERKNAPSSV